MYLRARDGEIHHIFFSPSSPVLFLLCPFQFYLRVPFLSLIPIQLIFIKFFFPPSLIYIFISASSLTPIPLPLLAKFPLPSSSLLTAVDLSAPFPPALLSPPSNLPPHPPTYNKFICGRLIDIHDRGRLEAAPPRKYCQISFLGEAEREAVAAAAVISASVASSLALARFLRSKTGEERGGEAS